MLMDNFELKYLE